jgi:hypothetical protein
MDISFADFVPIFFLLVDMLLANTLLKIKSNIFFRVKLQQHGFCRKRFWFSNPSRHTAAGKKTETSCSKARQIVVL